LAAALAADQWDHESWQLIARRYVLVARRAGALTQLPLALNSHTVVDIFAGDLAGAAELVDEADAVTEMTGTGLTPYGALWLAAWRGREQEARRLRDAALAGATARGEGIGLTVTHAASALLANAQGDYARASAEARQASDFGNELAAPGWGLYELIEASARLGDAGSAAEAFARLSPMLQASATGWALGVDARARALVTHHDGAEGLYREAIDLLGRTRVRAELARARLLYGEWLRRRRRRLDAREQLRSALEAFTTMGAEAFAERARRELLATGEKVRRRPVAAAEELTAQQAQIARMARRGLSNPEIGGELFLSPRTVEWHLGKIFTKLGISSRHQLDRFSL
jgi:DNA-binding CsgD family transcriptional regulator